VLASLRELDDFWAKEQTKAMSFQKAAAELSKLPAFRSFGGFRMTKEEAGFLYGSIQDSTKYYGNISTKELPKLFKDGDLDLETLKGAVPNASEHEPFDAGRHIDIVTKPFRALYQEYAKDREAAKCRKIDLRSLRRSKAWLDESSQASILDWAPIWRNDISPLIEEWITLLGSGSRLAALLDALCERAEQVVAGRGQGKQAPHQRTIEDETDLRNELYVRETSFRIGNGSQILSDISNALLSP
jgi:hypothetical protein